MNTLPASFPPVDALLAAVRKINWQQVGHRVLMATATMLAITVAVTLWAIRTGRQFWADHGAAIQSTARQVASRTATAAVTAWQAAGPVLGRLANRVADAVFHWLADGRPIPLPLPAITMAL